MVETDHGDTIRLIARIENEVGLRNIDDILGEADGIMLCRTSLGYELGPDKLGLMQKLVAAKAQAAGDSHTFTHTCLQYFVNCLLGSMHAAACA